MKLWFEKKYPQGVKWERVKNKQNKEKSLQDVNNGTNRGQDVPREVWQVV